MRHELEPRPMEQTSSALAILPLLLEKLEKRLLNGNTVRLRVFACFLLFSAGPRILLGLHE